MQEEGALKQKGRAKWIKLGDSNTRYFIAVIKERTHRKQIQEPQSFAGCRLTDPETIKVEIVDFYKTLMKTVAHSLPTIDKLVMQKRPSLSQQQRMFLCNDVTEKEIYKGLCFIGEDKAHGVNGYNACFFKKT